MFMFIYSLLLFPLFCVINIGMAKIDWGSGCESMMCSRRPCLQ